VVKDGRVRGQGVNRVTRDLDPTAHAEVVAIRDACRRLKTFSLEGCVLYSSCEPCPLCLGAALWARVDRVVYAATRLDAARAGFDDDVFRRTLGLSVRRPGFLSRLPIPGAVRPFDVWRAKSDKTPY
jgi:guanine deaminase